MNTTNIITIILITIAYTSFGQLTITAEDGAVTADMKFERKKVRVQGVALPDTGKNQIWDYSDLLICRDSSCDYSFSYKENTNPQFPNDAIVGQYNRGVLGYPMWELEYFTTSETGDFYKIGGEFIPIKFSGKALTGNPLDSLEVEHRIFQRIDLVCDFPLVFSKKWTSVSIDTVRYNISGTTVPIDNFLLENSVINNITREIVGEGQLILPYITKSGNIETVTYQALLLKFTNNAIGRIYTKGKENEMLLNHIQEAIGLKSEYYDNAEEYFFYIREMPGNVLYFNIINDGSKKIERISIRSDFEKHPPRKD